MAGRIKHSERKHNPLEGKGKRKRDMAKHLDKAIEYLETAQLSDANRKKGALSVMDRIKHCQKLRLRGKLKYCENQHYCEICHYFQIKDWSDRIDAYRKSLKRGRLYFYVRDEVFWFPDGIDWNRVDTEIMPLFKKRKQRLGSTLFRGMAGFVGMIHRIEICYQKKEPGIRLRSLMIIDKAEVYTDSIDWQSVTRYDSNHQARVKYVGIGKSRIGIQFYLNKYLPCNLRKGLMTKPEDIASFCYTMYNRATCVTAGKLFKKHK